MTLTPAEIRTLTMIATIGPAERIPNGHYVWRIGNSPVTRMVDSLIRKRALDVSADKSQAALTALGRMAIQERKAA